MSGHSFVLCPSWHATSTVPWTWRSLVTMPSRDAVVSKTYYSKLHASNHARRRMPWYALTIAALMSHFVLMLICWSGCCTTCLLIIFKILPLGSVVTWVKVCCQWLHTIQMNIRMSVLWKPAHPLFLTQLQLLQLSFPLFIYTHTSLDSVERENPIYSFWEVKWHLRWTPIICVYLNVLKKLVFSIV